ncbi:unnamed protein product, partial [Mesorhabditis spiculigera]
MGRLALFLLATVSISSAGIWVLMDASNCVHLKCEWRGMGTDCEYDNTHLPAKQQKERKAIADGAPVYYPSQGDINKDESEASIMAKIKAAHRVNTFTVLNDFSVTKKSIYTWSSCGESKIHPQLGATFRILGGQSSGPPFLPEEYAEELRGIAEAANLPLGEVVGLNILYDITAFDRKHIFGLGCTSLVAEDARGRIWHGRNLDYEMGDLLKNITVLIDFKRNGKTAFTGVTFVLYNGLLTGQRPGAFSISLNARYSGAYIDNILMEIYTRFRNPVSFVMREVLEEEQSYAWALDRLVHTPLICPAYITVAGINRGEGAIISRKRIGAADVWKLNKNRWYMVETNFDHWTPQGDKRKKVASHALHKLGQERLNADTLFNHVLSRQPVLNDLTIFTLVMSPSEPDVLFNHIVIRTNSTKKIENLEM